MSHLESGMPPKYKKNVEILMIPTPKIHIL